MLELITDLPDGIDGVRAVGTVAREDYEQVFEPLLDAARRAGRRIRFLYDLGPDFDRFTAGAAWDDARLGLQYLRLFERCAIVTDVGWVRDASRMLGALLPCPVKVFTNAERQDAIAWLGAPVETSAISYQLLPDKGVLLVEPQGRLRAEDFDALTTTVDAWLDSGGALNGLVVHAEQFPGWRDPTAFIRHMGFIRDHHRRLRRVALAADGWVADLAPRLAEHFVEAELKRFPYDKVQAAIAWAGQTD